MNALQRQVNSNATVETLSQSNMTSRRTSPHHHQQGQALRCPEVKLPTLRGEGFHADRRRPQDAVIGDSNQ